MEMSGTSDKLREESNSLAALLYVQSWPLNSKQHGYVVRAAELLYRWIEQSAPSAVLPTEEYPVQMTKEAYEEFLGYRAECLLRKSTASSERATDAKDVTQLRTNRPAAPGSTEGCARGRDQ
jgi:hypothetical protein